MAAPSGTAWGSIYGNYCRLGIYVSPVYDFSADTFTVEVWFWSKYSCTDSNNNFFFDVLSSSGSASTSKGSVSIATTVASGSGWSASNQVKLKTYTFTYNRTTSAQTKYVYARLNDVDKAGTPIYASTTFQVLQLNHWSVSYNANGGSGAPASQTKWYGKTLTLSSQKPTRTGYTFQGWATSASGSVAYSSGGSYTANGKNITLYAVWKAHTYTVSYNANGGSGAPANQTKTYGVNLTLSSTKPTRSLYNFKGWGTSASSTTVSYAAGASYTNNAAITLYAIWELAYVYPRITGFSIARCNSSGTLTEDGTYAKIVFNWATDYAISSITVKWKTETATSWTSTTITASGKSGSVSSIVGNGGLNNELIYSFEVVVADSIGSSTVKSTLNGILFPIDFLNGGSGIAIGKAATVPNALDIYKQTIIRGNQDASGTAASGQFIVGDPNGYHIAMDNNEIMAKTDAKTPGNIIINYDGGNVGIGNKDSKISLDGQIYILNAKSISGYNTSGEARRLLEINASNQAVFGYGGYSAGEGASYYDGNVVNIRSKGAINITSPTAGISNRAYGVNKVLWSGAYFMTAGHTVTLSENVSAQPHGIVLVFQYYRDGGVKGQHASFFIPKYVVPTSGYIQSNFIMSIAQFAIVGCKTLNLYNSKIIGSDVNYAEGTGTYSHIAYHSTYYVLSHVIGV